MYKIIIAISTSVFLFGCTHISITGVMCDEIISDPHATIPTECRNYNDEMATKASRIEKKVLSPNDIISFEKK